MALGCHVPDLSNDTCPVSNPGEGSGCHAGSGTVSDVASDVDGDSEVTDGAVGPAVPCYAPNLMSWVNAHRLVSCRDNNVVSIGSGAIRKA